MHKPHLRYRKQTPRERTWMIHLIAVEKVLRATVAVILTFKLLSLLGRDVHRWAVEFAVRHGIDQANRYVQAVLARLIGVGNTEIYELSAAAFCYAGLLYLEGIGLWLQKRWAEYLTASATALFIPVEFYELYEHFTMTRIAILSINIFVVWYLITRLRDEKKEAAVD
ncbi:MAG: DUF2127 domain-containing protein [Acidobacteria bacterium]|nr:DUF2127 domain-containing protein [Acidobacteriota bacterium]